MWKLMLLAGLGGFVGTCCRFLTNRMYLVFFKTTLPLATFTVNVLGCLILGLIMGLMNRAGIISPKVNALLVVGFCGGFTTFSTFSYETFNLGFNGEAFVSLMYVLCSVIAGLIAVWMGMQVTTRLL